MASEKAREAKLRRVASREGNVFRKVRTPYQEKGLMVTYELVEKNNALTTMWECLEDAEEAFGIAAARA